MTFPTTPPRPQHISLDTFQSELSSLSTANSSLHSRFFQSIATISRSDTWTPAEVEALRQEFEVFTQLLWKAKDIAGDIRTAVTDLQLSILSSFTGAAIAKTWKDTVIQQWIENLRQHSIHAKDLPDDCGVISLHLKALSENHIKDENNIRNGVQSRKSKGEGKHGAIHIFACILTRFLRQVSRLSFHSIYKRPVCGNLTRVHSIEASDASGVDQLKTVRIALDQLGNAMGIFMRIYDEVSKEVSEFQTLIEASADGSTESISSLKERLGMYARILETYQKTV